MKTAITRLLNVFALLALVALAACSPVATSTTAPTSAPAATTIPATSAASQAAPATAASAPTAVPTSAPSASQPATSASDTLVFATNISDLNTLDPATMYTWTGILTVNNLYQTLVRFEGADYTTLKPGLADKWDVKDAGGTWDITFTLHDGAKFASGNPVTADDVVYSFQRAIALKKGPSFLFTDIAGLTDQSIKATDPKTVTISLAKTYSTQAFLSILTFTIGSVVDSKVVKEHEANGDFGSTWLQDHSAGSGPYVLDHWTKETEILLKANPNYAGKVGTPNVLIQHVLESSNQQLGLEKGDIDVARSLTPDQIASLSGKEGVTVAKGNSLNLVYIGMNQKVKELANPKVREALRAAVDYDGLVKGLLGGNAINVQTVIPKGLLGYNPETPFQANVDQAKQLLKDAGYPDGLTLELTAPTGNAPGGGSWADITAKLQSDYAAAGITINIKQVPYSELYNTYRAGTHQLIIVEWGPDYEDPDGNVLPFADAAAKSIAARNGWDDPEIAKQARAASLITDPTQRAAAYQTLTDQILHNGPYVFLFQPIEQFGLRSNVKGFEWKPAGWVDFSAVTK